jgi:hypothetical protein
MNERIFRLKGERTSAAATATITVDGTEVFSGSLLDGMNNPSEPAPGEPDQYLCEFPYTYEDTGAPTNHPVVITLLTGSALIGMFKYNCSQIVNPALTPEELAYVTAGTEADAPPEVSAAVHAKGGWYICEETAFSYGLDPAYYYNNRTLLTLNNVPLMPEETVGHDYITVKEGDILAFTTTVFEDHLLHPTP